MTYWLVMVAAYDGDVYFTVVANSLIHAAMYLYYLLTSLGARPSWGAHLTKMQMIQFLCMNAQAAYILWAGCAYPHPLTKFYLVYIISLFFLFGRFYVARWVGGSKKGKKE